MRRSERFCYYYLCADNGLGWESRWRRSRRRGPLEIICIYHAALENVHKRDWTLNRNRIDRGQDKTRGCGWQQRHHIYVDNLGGLSRRAAAAPGFSSARFSFHCLSLLVDVSHSSEAFTPRNRAKPFLGPVEGKVLIKLLNITSYPLKHFGNRSILCRFRLPFNDRHQTATEPEHKLAHIEMRQIKIIIPNQRQFASPCSMAAVLTHLNLFFIRVQQCDGRQAKL